MSDQDVLFRAWHTQEKKMLFFSLWELLAEYGDEGNYCSIVDTDLFQYGRDIPNLKIMQYIGRLDHHDKEMCEGDIVEYIDNTSRGLVKKITVIRDIRHLPDFSCSKWEEIIGNIYENPELERVSTWQE